MVAVAVNVVVLIYNTHLELTLEEAVKGVKNKFVLPQRLLVKWVTAQGQKRLGMITCKICGGQGQVRMQQGFFTVQQTCPTCRGKGQMKKTRVMLVMAKVVPTNKNPRSYASQQV